MKSHKDKTIFNKLQQIINNKNIRTLFQPIVSLVDGSILGYEALSRGPVGSEFERPDILFKAAEEYGLVWELEYLCRIKALENASKQKISKMLFLNVDPKVIYDEKFKSGFTRDFIKEYNLNPQNIIFEITEKSCIEDYKIFKQIIDNYINQGYKIALDDTGAGYSGLRMIAETSPQCIKIDMELIRDIDKKPINQALVKALKEFAYAMNMDIIAEGIETVNELKTIINLGIKYGQGYLLQKPMESLEEIKPEVKEMIAKYREIENILSYYSANNVPIGDLARVEKSINIESHGKIVHNIFSNNPHIQGIPVTDSEGNVAGLVMRSSFYTKLATQYGNAVFMNRPIRLVMNNSPLVVDYNTPLSQVSNIAMNRKDENLYDYIIITSKDKNYYGVITVKEILDCITKLELDNAKHSNPLTGLPGNVIIEYKLNKIIQERQNCYVMYYDLDNFKAYNDVYGFENGDKILKLQANIIQKCIIEAKSEYNFVGHIGGDDFISIVTCEDIQRLLEKIIRKFDTKIRGFYNREDLLSGYIECNNRKGKREKFPIISMSIAVTNIMKNNFNSCDDLGEYLSEIKKQCKKIIGSCYIID
jgi:diguanylate cyclase (GGDEF)-like protein